MTPKEFSRFCTDEGSPLRGCYHDAGCEVVPAGGVSQAQHSTATRDAAAKLHADVAIIKLAAKLDKVIELLTKRIKAENAAPKKKAMDQMAAFDQMEAARSARACAEAREAYATRNPHRNDRFYNA